MLLGSLYAVTVPHIRDCMQATCHIMHLLLGLPMLQDCMQEWAGDIAAEQNRRQQQQQALHAARQGAFAKRAGDVGSGSAEAAEVRHVDMMM